MRSDLFVARKEARLGGGFRCARGLERQVQAWLTEKRCPVDHTTTQRMRDIFLVKDGGLHKNDPLVPSSLFLNR